LERNGNVVSRWDIETGGPARRIYQLTASGEEHLTEWAAVLDHVSKSMSRFVKKAHALKIHGSIRSAKAI
jgi:DNA-binding PadR family transcriptional regulator